jgi:uncharacterized protein YggE
MPPAFRQALVVGSIATLCTLCLTLAVSAAGRPPVLITTPIAQPSTGTAYPTGIQTFGDATVSKKPDVAFVSVGVDSQAPTAAAAQRDLADKAGKLTARAKALGIADSDINTNGYWIGPNYTPGGTIDGYRAAEDLELKWHKVDATGTALDALVQEGGATHVGVAFGLADPKAARAEARALAIADARSKAQAMAAAAGVKVGAVLRISDTASSSPQPRYDLPGAAAPSSTQLPTGQLDITVTVEVDFALA